MLKARSSNNNRKDFASPAPRLLIFNFLTEDGIKYRFSNGVYEADGECSPNHPWMKHGWDFNAVKRKAY